MDQLSHEIDEWVAKWERFITGHARLLSLRSSKDEILQTAALTYWEVIKKFIPGKGKALDTFILDMVKLRLIDMKRKESRAPITCEDVILTSSVALEPEDIDWLYAEMTPDSAAILKLLHSGYSANELQIKIGIPRRMIQRVKDETIYHFLKGGVMVKFRDYLVERAHELSLRVPDDIEDLALANMILTNGQQVRRRFKVVPVSEENKGDLPGRKCAAQFCENPAANRLKFCSQSCAESELKAVKQDAKGPKGIVRRKDELKVMSFTGETGEAAIAALPNPFEAGSSAREVFELFRTGGTRAELAAALGEVCERKEIKCTSPDARIRRVVTDARRLGFELPKSRGGVFRLTGRRKE